MINDKIKNIDYEKYTTPFFLFIILMYSATKFIDPSINKVPQFFLGLGLFFLIVKNPNNIRKDPMVILFMCIIISQVATWSSVKLFHPEVVENSLKIDRLGKLLLFIPIAWCLKDNKKYIYTVFIVATVGFILSLFIHCDFVTEVTKALQGQRVDFGIRNAQHTSMIFGIILISSVYFLINIKKNLVRMSPILLFIPISIAGLIVTQTRQTFLSLFIAFSVLFILFCAMKIKNIKYILIAAGILFVIGLSSVYSLGIHNRNNDIVDTLNTFVEPVPADITFNNIEDVVEFYIKRQHHTSSGIRLQLGLAALPWIIKKPFLGWGSDARSFIIKNSKVLKKKNIDGFGHIHNYWIEILLSYGVIGLFLMSSVYGWLLLSAYKIRNIIGNGKEIFLFSAIFVSYWMVINNFESFNSFWTGVFVHNILLGCIYANYLHTRESK